MHSVHYFECVYSLYKQAPFEPRSNQYAHLACFLGHRTVLNIILQYRKDDHRAFLVCFNLFYNVNMHSVHYFECVYSLYKQAPFEPRSNQYAHLACFLGHRTVLNIILQYRKDDHRASKKLNYCPNGNEATERRREVRACPSGAEVIKLFSCSSQLTLKF